MRRSSKWVWGSLASALVFASCAIPLDDEAADPNAPPVATGCALFGGAHPAPTSLAGSGRSVAVGADEMLWVFEAAGVDGAAPATVLVPGARVPVSAGGDGCFTDRELVRSDRPESLFEPSPLGDALLISPLDGVQVDATTWLYYGLFEPAPEDAFGVRLVGHGVAPFDEARGRFVPSEHLLWGADQPSYGSSATVADGRVLVYGCRAGDGLLVNDCYVARAPADALANEAAYEHYAGGGRWSARADEAVMVFAAGSASVRYHDGIGRYLLTAVGVFGDRVEARTARWPEGPWSDPVELARCDLPAGDPDAFCGPAIQHPQLLTAEAGSARSVWFSYGLQTLGDRAQVERTPEAYWPRLVSLELPLDLP